MLIPEFIYANSHTYKLIDITSPVFVLMAEDGNGQSEIITLNLLVYKDKKKKN